MSQRARTVRRLEVWLKETQQPLYVLNSQQRLVFFNQGCERLTGFGATDVLGHVCNYTSEQEPHSVAAVLASLAPPPEVWSGKPIQSVSRIVTKSADPVRSSVSFFPLMDEEGSIKAVLGVVIKGNPTTNIPVDWESQRYHVELAELRQSIRARFGDGTLVARSLAMQRALHQMKVARSSTCPVLLIGEAGTGKQHLARVLHYQSPLGKRPFVPIDCRRAATEDLTETLNRLRESRQSDELT
ncbi:MAG: hypothetical protein FJ267_01185, partial [Planctomycetes bacterium]|nr:hypothetical protein [Planctomycetota bacterium]